MIGEDLRTQTAHLARIDGAVAGTPFLIALILGYLAYLRQESRMVLRTAALLPEKPDARRSPRTRVRSVYVLLMLGGFLDAPSDAKDEGSHAWLKASVGS